MILFLNGARKAFHYRVSENDQNLNERDFARTMKFKPSKEFFEKVHSSEQRQQWLFQLSLVALLFRQVNQLVNFIVVKKVLRTVMSPALHLVLKQTKQFFINPPPLNGKAKVTHLFAYAQMLSIREQDFRADSTFPRDTYSPACSFTRSFFRSESKYKKALHIQAHQMQTVCACVCDRDHAGSRLLPCNQV